MKVTPLALPEVRLVEPTVHEDPRGFFLESWNARTFAEHGIDAQFVQDNHSGSVRDTLRGLHYQVCEPQGKLVRVVSGRVFDVAADVRRGSPSFGRWVGAELSAQDRRQLWIPPGFAHGFLVLSEWAEVLYKTSTYYARDDERCIRFDDPTLAIVWPLDREPLLSARDRAGASLAEADPVDT